MRKIGLGLAFVMGLCAASAGAQDPGAPPAPVPQTPPTAPLDRTVTLDVQNSPLARVIESIDQQAGLSLAYSDQILPKDKLVTLNVRNITARQALAAALEGTGIVLRVSNGVLILAKETQNRTSEGPSDAAVGIVWGVVTDSASGERVPNVVVSVKGTAIRASTRDGGSYQLNGVPSGRQTIITRLLGYLPLEREVTVADDRRERVDFALKHSLTRLQEVVTTATGPQRRLELGNDITVLNADSIVRTMPITSVTDILEGRVPGLIVQRSSGAPGDPARIRLRGASSPNLTNDPIVVVDGIRVSGPQSGARAGNLAGGGEYAAPSPLDYIDPNSIQTIEVLKGPSAATLYGQDAANGVILITTKKGKSGPPSWDVQVDRGRTQMAGQYPDLMLRWGHQLVDNTPVLCPITDRINAGFTQGAACVVDSVTSFQLLSAPDLTILDRGASTGVSLTVRGGSSGNTALTYALTGTYRDELGLIRLPDYEVERFRAAKGVSPPDWMARPQRLKYWSATSGIAAQLGSNADVSLTSTLSRTNQQRSQLEAQLGRLMTTYLDRASGTYYRVATSGVSSINPIDVVLTDYYQRARATATAFTNAANLNWRPRTWLSANIVAGLNVNQRADEILIPSFSADSANSRTLGQGTELVSTVNMQATAHAPLGRGFNFQFTTGLNYNGESIADLNGNPTSDDIRISESRTDKATYGWYVAPSLNHKRLWLSTGLRLDGGSTFGSRLKLPAFPKLGLSYLVSDEPFFPQALKSVFNVLRLRVAYGHAGAQPGPADRLRLYQAQGTVFVDGQFVNGVELDRLGNTQLRPERSKEIEGGFDADLLDDRLSFGLSSYRKTRVDAIVAVPLAPSVYPGTVLQNVGVIRDMGVEFSMATQLLRSDAVRWGANLSVSQSRNEVVKLAPGVLPFFSGETRVAAGYPLFGRWALPILGYADANGNGVLETGEVSLGDTAVYVGQTLPNYTANLATTASFFRGMITIVAGLAYEDGLSQQNQTALDLLPFSRALNDPSASFSEQAAALTPHLTPFGRIQTVSTLRFSNLSVILHPGSSVARWLGARTLSLALQGQNLGLKTNYRGLDPSVNARFAGNNVVDTGVLPQPRTWQLRVNATY